jgi:hypothetical protein
MFFGLGGGPASRRAADATIGVGYAVRPPRHSSHLQGGSGEAHDIFLSGNILGITRADTLVLLAVTIPVLVVHALFYKEFLFVSSTARRRGRWLSRDVLEPGSLLHRSAS